MKTCAWLAVIVGAILTTNCSCERRDQRPYTPFGIASSLPAFDAGPAAASATARSQAAPFTVRHATQHKPPTSQLSIAGHTLKAPEGMSFSLSLPVPGRTGDVPGVLVWLVRSSGRGAKRAETPLGQLRLVTDNSLGQRLTGFPGFIPTHSGCKHDVHLTATGQETVTLDVAARCSGTPLPSRTPIRSIQVIAPFASKPSVLALRTAAAPKHQTVTVTTNSQDRDGDGHDDVELHFTLTSESSPREASAKLRWLSRAAGLARDFSEPGRSLSAIGSIETVRAKGNKTARRVRGRINNSRRLMSYLCGEYGTPHVTHASGDPMDCKLPRRVADLALEAEVRSALTLKEPGRALFALEHSDWWPGGSPKARSKLHELWSRAVPHRQTQRRDYTVPARRPGPSPQYSPLRFAPDGSLLVMGVHEIWRLRGDVREDASEEVDPWPLVPEGPEGEQLLGMSFPCGSSELALTSQTPDGGQSLSVQGPWLSPRPGLCRPGTRFSEPELRVGRWQGTAPQILFGSEDNVRGNAGPQPAGSPWSSRGTSAIARTRTGLLVSSPRGTELWPTVTEELEQCVVDNAANAAACLTRRGVRRFERDGS